MLLPCFTEILMAVFICDFFILPCFTGILMAGFSCDFVVIRTFVEYDC